MSLEKALSHVTLLSVISSNNLIKQIHQIISSNNFHKIMVVYRYRVGAFVGDPFVISYRQLLYYLHNGQSEVLDRINSSASVNRS